MNEILFLAPYAAPVAFAGIGETIGQKSGVINIGLEGTMLTAAYFAMVGASGPHGTVFAGAMLAVLAAIVLSMISAYFVVTLAADQVVVGTAINLFAIGLTRTLFRAKFGDSGSLLSLPIFTRFHGVDLMEVGLVVSLPIVWFLLQKTSWGLIVRGAGENPVSVEAAGYSVTKVRYGALLLASVFSGLAGAYLVLGTTGTFIEEITAGRGFIAIAVVTFARWKVSWVALWALFLGYLNALQFELQAKGVHAPFELVKALPYVVALLVLVVFGKAAQAPASLALPYRRTR